MISIKATMQGSVLKMKKLLNLAGFVVLAGVILDNYP